MNAELSNMGGDAPGRPPGRYWLIPLVVAALRAIPFLLTRIVTPLGGSSLPAVGYNPLDSFAYVAFVRQAAESGAWLLANPHTILPQDGRYVLPFFSLLGQWCRWTGLDPFWALELARIPLLFIFFAVLWHFLGVVLPTPRQRLMAGWLVGFSGGIELLVLPTLGFWPAKLRVVALTALSTDHGWSTFGALNNPLWVAGLTVTLIALRPVVAPAGSPNWQDRIQLLLGLVAAYYIHPYSGLVVLGVAVMLPLLRWALGLEGWGRAYLSGIGLPLGIALAFIGVVSMWQNQDEVFRLTAQGVFGDNQLSVFWYPVTLGAVGVLALRGWRCWIGGGAPYGIGMGAWTLALVFMHSSPLFNGYHFAFHLHLPLCVAAAGPLDELCRRRHGLSWLRRLGTGLLLTALFQSALTVTFLASKQALSDQIPAPIVEALRELSSEPPGTVYTAPHIGTLIPAYTGHRVYVGHWFLTPGYTAKQAYFNALMEGRASPEGLAELVQKEAITYVLLPPGMPRPVVEAVRPLAKRILELQGYTLLSTR